MPVRMRSLAFTIAAAASQSGAMQLNGLMAEAIDMPGTWTAAALSFMACDTESGTFLPLFDVAGVEIALTVDASRRVVLPISLIRGHNWLKLRSGLSTGPQVQAGIRTLTLLTRDFS